MVNQLWNDNETNILIENYSTHTVRELVDLLDGKYTETQIRNKIFKLGLKKKNKWTKDLIDYLTENAGKKSTVEMRNEKLKGFTENAIYKKMNQLGITSSSTYDKWTKKEVELLEKLFEIKTNKELQEMLPRFNISQIKSKAKAMGLKKLPLIKYKAIHEYTNSNVWSDYEKKLLIEHYGKIPNKQIQAEYLPDRSIEAIKKKASLLGLTDKLRYETNWLQSVCSFDPNELKVSFTYRKVRGDEC